MRLKKSIAIIATLFVASCSSDPVSSESHSQEEQEIVFGNDRNVESSRGIIAFAGDQPEIDQGSVSARANLYQAGIVSRATATIRIVKSCGGTPSTTRGSGTLTSTTRLATAWHNVFGDDDEIFDIEFESMVGEMPGDGVSGWWAEDNITNYQFQDHQNGRYRYGGEENPLLANRLFSLGLRRVAYRTATPRFSLYRWKGTWDEVPGSPGYKGQGMMNVDTQNSVANGRDLAVLRVTSNPAALDELFSSSIVACTETTIEGEWVWIS